MQRCIKDGRVVLTYIVLYSLLYDAKISCKMCEIFLNNNHFLLIKTFITYNLTEMWHNRVFSCNHRICLCDTKMVPRNERKILHKCVYTHMCALHLRSLHKFVHSISCRRFAMHAWKINLIIVSLV